MRILILRGGALGDFIVTLPALRWLRERWPGCWIELVGNANAAELGLACGYIDAVHSQHDAKWSALYKEEALPGELRVWFESFELIVSFWSDPEGDLRRHFVHRGSSFLASNPQVFTRPAALHFCEVFYAFGWRASDFVVPLRFPEAIKNDARGYLGSLQHFVAIHPSSGSPKKNWPVPAWKELITRLGSRPLLVIRGEADPEITFDSRLDFLEARSWPLPILGAALAKADVFIGHDTGVAHLAAAAGAPCVLLFGPTEPEIWAPPYPGVRVIRRGQEMDSIGVDDVLSDVRNLSGTNAASGAITNRHGFSAQSGPA
jgi:ADP-heptose:LPS heptosyltransferase